MKIYNFISNKEERNNMYYVFIKNKDDNRIDILKFKKYPSRPLTKTKREVADELKEDISIEDKFQTQLDKIFDREILIDSDLSRRFLCDLRKILPAEENWFKFCGSKRFSFFQIRHHPASLFSDTFNLIEENAQPVNFDNSFAKTYNSKDYYYLIADKGDKDVSVFFPTSSSNISDESDSILIVNSYQRNYHFIGFDNSEMNEIEYKTEDAGAEFSNSYKEIIENNIPSLTLSEVSNEVGADGVDIEVSCVYNDEPLREEVYITNDCGYISKQKIILDETGKGTFKFIPLGLSSGDVSTIKVGFKLFTGLASIQLTAS